MYLVFFWPAMCVPLCFSDAGGIGEGVFVILAYGGIRKCSQKNNFVVLVVQALLETKAERPDDLLNLSFREI